MIIILTIIFAITALIGLYFLIKPDNFFLPYLGFGGVRHAKKYIKTKEHKKNVLIWMRIVGAVVLVISIWFLIDVIAAQ